jgi:hypothetical protein
MNNDLLNILSNSNKDIDNQQLMDYLSGKLSDEEKHAVEKGMADSAFMNDAVEGLENIGNKKDIQAYVEELNAGLQKSLSRKKQRRLKRRLKEGPWGYVAILLIILLCIAAYLILRKVMLVGR